MRGAVRALKKHKDAAEFAAGIDAAVRELDSSTESVRVSLIHAGCFLTACCW